MLGCGVRVGATHPCTCSMTSGAMKQGVPQNVLRARYMRWPQEPSLRCGPPGIEPEPEPAGEPGPGSGAPRPIALMDARAASTAGGAQGLPGELPGGGASPPRPIALIDARAASSAGGAQGALPGELPGAAAFCASNAAVPALRTVHPSLPGSPQTFGAQHFRS